MDWGEEERGHEIITNASLLLKDLLDYVYSMIRASSNISFLHIIRFISPKDTIFQYHTSSLIFSECLQAKEEPDSPRVQRAISVALQAVLQPAKYVPASSTIPHYAMWSKADIFLSQLSQSSGQFSGLMNQKRNSQDATAQARRASFNEQKPAAGIIGNMWNKLV